MDLSELTENEVYRLAIPVWKEIIKGSNTMDFDVFSSSFTEELKNRIGREKFENQCNEFPLLTSLGAAEPVACIWRDKGVTVLFRQHSTKLEGEFVGQIRLNGSTESIEVTDVQVY